MNGSFIFVTPPSSETLLENLLTEIKDGKRRLALPIRQKPFIGSTLQDTPKKSAAVDRQDVRISPNGLAGTLAVPKGAPALIIFAHGSGSSRFSPRNMMVADRLNQKGFATLLFDLLTQEEEARDREAHVFDIALLAERLVGAIQWVDRSSALRGRPLGLFGASTGAAAALVSAAQLGQRIGAVVSRGGRPDLAGEALPKVQSPTLLIVGAADYGVIGLNEQAYQRLRVEKNLVFVPGATHLFSEPGALEQVVDYAVAWFKQYLCGHREHAARS